MPPFGSGGGPSSCLSCPRDCSPHYAGNPCVLWGLSVCLERLDTGAKVVVGESWFWELAPAQGCAWMEYCGTKEPVVAPRFQLMLFP